MITGQTARSFGVITWWRHGLGSCGTDNEEDRMVVVKAKEDPIYAMVIYPTSITLSRITVAL